MRNSIKISGVLVLAAFILFCWSSLALAQIPQVERDALIALYNSANGANWTNNSGWLGNPGTECSWYGVTCDAEGNHVVRLELYDNQLTGSIPPELGNLANLQWLHLGLNQLTGSIPPELGNLANLQWLHLGLNQLTGSIPPELANLTNLQRLFLESNQLTGTIPPTLGNLANLQCLNLSSNQLTGSIPPELGNLANLQELYLWDNQLTGSIPPALGNLTNLKWLSLDSNQLTGSIPPALGNLANLQRLYLLSNQLTGTIPPTLGNLANLQYLSLHDNQLTGTIPPELGNLANLQALELCYNQLTGTIPPELGNLANLQRLYLLSNQLTGSIPTELTNLTSLKDNKSDFRYNALYTADTTLESFLNSKQSGGDWQGTQTVAPTNLMAEATGSATVALTWTPIQYTADSGGYEIYTVIGESYTLKGTTADKTAVGYTVTGLDPGTTYTFAVRARTDSHGMNQNTVYSEYATATSTNPDGTQKWAFETGADVSSSPAIGSDATIYVGSEDNKLYAINPDGTQKWAFQTGDNMWSSPAIGTDGTIYVGSADNKLYAINPDGTQKWAFETGDSVASSPAIGPDGTIYVGSWDKKLYAINPDGTQKWAFQTGDNMWSSPAIGTDGTIYVGSWDNKLYAINPDGTQKWAFETGDPVASSPAIGPDGTIYVGSYDNKLYAINPDGTQKWAFETGDPVASSPAIGPDGTIYVGSWDKKLYAINPDGTQKWAFETGNYVASSPAIGTDGTIYVGSWDNKLYAINPDGTQKWAFETGDPVASSPAIGPDGTIYVGSYDNNLYAIEGSSGGLANSPWPMFRHDLRHTGNVATVSSDILYFPHIASVGTWETEICVINSSDTQTLNGVFKAYNDAGVFVSEIDDVTLAPHGRREIRVGAEFPNPTNIGYIIFESNSSAVAGYTKFYVEGRYRVAIPAVSEINTGDIYISHIASTSSWGTGVSLLNTTSSPKTLTIEFDNGQTRTVDLLANEHSVFLIKNLFGEQPQPDIHSAVIKEGSGVVGLELFSIGNQMSGILLKGNTTTSIYYPHTASEGGWATGIVAYNPSDTDCDITITPYTAAGDPLTPATATIGGKEQYIGIVSLLGFPLDTAWLQIESTSPITGFELFAKTNLLAGYTGVGITGTEGIFAKLEKDGATGIAFVNIEDSIATVTLTAYDDSGAVIATETINLDAHQKALNTAEGIFAGSDISNATYITYSSDKEVVGFQLNASSDGMMLDGLPGM